MSTGTRTRRRGLATPRSAQVAAGVILAADALLWQPLPRWSCRQGERAVNPGGVGLAAGAALLALDQVVRADPPWLGAWRMRQALRAAEASAAALRMPTDASALRDAHILTRPGDDPGPAGRLLRLWRDLAHDPVGVACRRLVDAARELGMSLPPEALRGSEAPGGCPITGALEAATGLFVALADPAAVEGEVLAWMGADLALAACLGWRTSVPLLATAATRPGPRAGGGRRARPGEAAWPAFCWAVYARAAQEAHALALDMNTRAGRLLVSSGTVRTRERAAGVAALLGDDAVSAPALTELGSDRAARRFLERLALLGAVRELTGRTTFRLYGL